MAYLLRLYPPMKGRLTRRPRVDNSGRNPKQVMSKKRRPWLPYVTLLAVYPATLFVTYAPFKSNIKSPQEVVQVPQISPYDSIIKKYAHTQGIDWRLIASIIYTESSFRQNAVSPKGARGLMQIMPIVAREQGVQGVHLPEENIRAGVNHLNRKLHLLRGATKEDQLQLSLAAYNSGLGHLRDAQILAMQLGKSSRRWSDVKEALLLLEQPEYSQNAKYGYCRGSETVEYVHRVLRQYAHYQKNYPLGVQVTWAMPNARPDSRV